MSRMSLEDTLKSRSDYIEKTELGDLTTELPGSSLSEPHKAYLLQRHGTLDLDPVPSMDPADPYNWPLLKVRRPFSVDRDNGN